MKQQLLSLASPLSAPIVIPTLKKFYRSNREVTPFEKVERVLLFAPHIDDETIGAGGMIRKYASAGTEVHIAIITNGNRSNTNNVQIKTDLSEVRKQELLSIQDLLGFSSVTYFDYSDGEVKSVPTPEKYAALIDKVKPDLIYTTSLIDAHPDHVYNAHLTAEALKKVSNLPSGVREYEINCPVPPEYINCVMDITEEFSVKKEATQAFASQAIAFDGFLALAGIKAALVKDKKVKYVETFIETTPSQFIEASTRLKQQDMEYYRHFKQANRTLTLHWAIFKNLDVKKALYKSR